MFNGGFLVLPRSKDLFSILIWAQYDLNKRKVVSIFAGLLHISEKPGLEGWCGWMG